MGPFEVPSRRRRRGCMAFFFGVNFETYVTFLREDAEEVARQQEARGTAGRLEDFVVKYDPPLLYRVDCRVGGAFFAPWPGQGLVNFSSQPSHY